VKSPRFARRRQYRTCSCPPAPPARNRRIAARDAVEDVERRCGPGEAIFRRREARGWERELLPAENPTGYGLRLPGREPRPGRASRCRAETHEGLRAERLVRPGEPPAAPTAAPRWPGSLCQDDAEFHKRIEVALQQDYGGSRSTAAARFWMLMPLERSTGRLHAGDRSSTAYRQTGAPSSAPANSRTHAD